MDWINWNRIDCVIRIHWSIIASTHVKFNVRNFLRPLKVFFFVCLFVCLSFGGITSLLEGCLETGNWGRQISFFLFFFFNLILFFNFTILYWFCYISKWIHHRYTCVPHPEPSSLLPPHTIPLGRPAHQPQASSIVHWTWTGDSFHIWYYTYFNAILPNHPTLSLSHRVQKTVLYICVSFAVSYTGLLLPSF